MKSGRSPDCDVSGVTLIGNGAEPFAIEMFDSAFQAAAISAAIREIRSDHAFGFAPMEI